MLDMTFEQGHQVFLNALAGNNFSQESVRAYSADITQFIDFLQSTRVDWNNPKKLERLDIVGFMNRLAGLRRSGTTRARKLASLRHFLKFLKENGVIEGNPAETVIRARKEEKDPTVLFKNEYKALLFEAQENSRDYAILLTFLKSGIRESELADLQIDDVDFPSVRFKPPPSGGQISSPLWRTATIALHILQQWRSYGLSLWQSYGLQHRVSLCLGH
jgi:site-specific recombinase XerD